MPVVRPRSSRTPDDAKGGAGAVNAIRRLWKGEAPVREIFWNWLVFRGILVNAGCTFLALALVATAPEGATSLLWLAVLLHLAAIPYNLACLVGIWRSAARTPDDATAAALKLAAALLVVLYVVV